jgi:SAM-dependent methyltransferase
MLSQVKSLLKKSAIVYATCRATLRWLRAVRANWYASERSQAMYCFGCDRSWRAFQSISPKEFKSLKAIGWPYGLDDAETLNHRAYRCWDCGSTDRDRLSMLFLERTLQRDAPYRMVEFAPAPAVGRYLSRKHPAVQHRTADLYMSGVHDRVDIRDLRPYRDGEFDLFVCSHVLEHVDNDIAAMHELHRILRPGGFGIVMVPIITKLEKTIEDPSIVDPSTRMRLFGQHDHVRLYAKRDFLERLTAAGFTVQALTVADFGTRVGSLRGAQVRRGCARGSRESAPEQDARLARAAPSSADPPHHSAAQAQDNPHWQPPSGQRREPSRASERSYDPRSVKPDD